METGAWRWTRSFPAGSCSSSSTPRTHMGFEDYSEYENSYRMGMLLDGPQDERDLSELWTGPFSPPTNNMKEVNLTHEIEYGTYPPITYDGMTIQTCVHVTPVTEMVREIRRPMLSATWPDEEDPATTVLIDERRGKSEEEEDEKEEEMREGSGSTRPLPCHRRQRPVPTTASSLVDLLDHIPRSGRGPRGPRKRGTWPPNHFLLHRKNNDHWTRKEVKLLVDGVSELGVGHWTELKNRWFSDPDPVRILFKKTGPIRTPMHLKDKWRNLVEAYVFSPTSKKKGCEPLDKGLISRIRMLAAE